MRLLAGNRVGQCCVLPALGKLVGRCRRGTPCVLAVVESVRARLLTRWCFVATPRPTPAVPLESRVDTASHERLSSTNTHSPSPVGTSVGVVFVFPLLYCQRVSFVRSEVVLGFVSLVGDCGVYRDPSAMLPGCPAFPHVGRPQWAFMGEQV